MIIEGATIHDCRFYETLFFGDEKICFSGKLLLYKMLENLFFGKLFIFFKNINF